MKIPQGWEIKKLKDCAKAISNGAFNNPNRVGKGYKLINVVDLYSEPTIKFDDLNLLDLSQKEYERYKVLPDDLFYTRSSLKLEGIAHCNIADNCNDHDKVVFECHVIRLRADKQQIFPKYLFYYSKGYSARKHFMSRAKFTTMTTLDQHDLGQLSVFIPPFSEQKKIAEILTSWDVAIEDTEKFITAKKIFKKGVMQKLLSGKVRFQGFADKAELRKLKGLVKEVSIRNKNIKTSVVLSVTNTNGFVVQTEHFDKSVASADISNYKIVRQGQFGFNPSRVNVGSIAILEKNIEGALSPMYVIFKTVDGKLLPQYMKQFIKSSWFIGHVRCLTQGSVRDSLSFDALEQIRIFAPSIDEQKRIADTLSAIDKEIELLERKRDLLKKQKKGLMQKLLTGKIRVKV